MGPLDGIRVVEVGLWVAGPSCSGILADWGADVIKVEPLVGDPFRGLAWVYPDEINPPFELDNRGKRSIALDITRPRGREIALRLIEGADVFCTNYRPGGLERAGLDHATLLERFPALVYALITGYGAEGPERDRAAYDVGAFYGRTGMAAALTPGRADLPYPRGGMGDHPTGMAAAGGVTAALFHRERTGRGQLVSTSLLRTGAYVGGWDNNVTARVGTAATAVSRTAPPNPVINGYRCRDGRWLHLLGLEGDRHWPTVAGALGHPEWLEDPRFASVLDRATNSAALVALMDEVFASGDLEHWADELDRHGVWWSPVQDTLQFRADPASRRAGCWVDVPLPDGGRAEMVASPVDFAGSPWAVARPSPELGQHTEEVLLELGMGWDEVEQLKDDGLIP